MFTDRQVRNWLKRARALIARPYGWTKGRMYKQQPNRNVTAYCLLGAMFEARPRGVDIELARRSNAMILLATEIEKATGSFAVTSWNDARTRTKRQVLQLLDNTIESI